MIAAARRPLVDEAPPQRRALSGRAAAAIGLAALLLLVFIVAPLGEIVFEAAHAGWAPMLATFADRETQAAIGLTLGAALIAVAFNAAFGLIAAWTLTKYRFPGKAALQALIDLPLTVSPVVAGLALLLTFGTRSPAGAWAAHHGFPIAFARPGIVVATIFVTFPYVARELIALMSEQGRELEEAAIALGASAWQTFRRVTFPEIRGAFINGVLLCNARAMGEFGAVAVISGRIRGLTDTVSLQISNLYDGAAIVSAFTLAGTLAVVAIALTFARRKKLGD
jgi:sulfate/thiosulfate transport system permease protein